MTEQIQQDESAEELIVGNVVELDSKPQVVTPEKAAVNTKKKVVKKAKSKKKGEVHTLTSGIKVKFLPIAANLIVDAQTEIPDPPIPTFKNPTTGKDEPNPGSPTYNKELAEVQLQRAKVSMNMMLLFGLELVDPIPEDNLWLRKLKYAKRVANEEYASATNLEDEDSIFLRELLYKKYIVVDSFALGELSKLAGVTEEMLARAQKSFPGN